MLRARGGWLPPYGESAMVSSPGAGRAELRTQTQASNPWALLVVSTQETSTKLICTLQKRFKSMNPWVIPTPDWMYDTSVASEGARDVPPKTG